jgi:Holliday junction resolvase RusA-like endonuclease
MTGTPITVRVRVDGRQAAQGSKRLIGRNLVEMNKGLPAYRKAIVTACEETGVAGMQLTGPIHASVVFHMRRPKAHYTARGELRPDAPHWCSTPPDIDKLLRAVFDAIGSRGAHLIQDDRLIARVDAQTVYAAGSPATEITVTTLT